jgi:MoxR-like ATPase
MYIYPLDLNSYYQQQQYMRQQQQMQQQQQQQQLQQYRLQLPTVTEDFVGRNVAMYLTIVEVLNRRLTTLVGEAGVGKTALATAVTRWVGYYIYRVGQCTSI